MTTEKLTKKQNMLSEKQRQVLHTILDYTKDHGYPPTVRELCELTNLKSTSTMHGHLQRLERDGYIVRVHGGPRTIKVIKTA